MGDMMASAPVYAYRVGQLGDSLVSLPAIYALKQAIGDTPLILITDHSPGKTWTPSWEVFRLTNFFSQHFDYKPLVSSKLAGIFDLIRVAARIRHIGGNKVFLFIDPGSTPARLARFQFFFHRLAGLRIIGLDEAAVPYHPRNGDGRLREVLPEHVRLQRIVTNHYGKERCEDPNGWDFPAVEIASRSIDKLWGKMSIADSEIPVAFGPGSKMPSKRWPTDRFAELGKELIRTHRIYPIVFGSSEESDLGEDLVRKWGKGSNAAGKLSIAESASLMRGCAFYIGNDTGAMHLAATVNLPCVCLFSCRDNPGRWNPVNNGHQILRAWTECEGCSATECPFGNPKCMELIELEEVVDAARTMLTRLE
jgi:ADP-heptose:LPS heptosyltransferase